MKWLLIFCLLAVHQINAMPNREEEEVFDSLEEMAGDSNDEFQEEEINSVEKRDVKFNDEEEEKEDEEETVNSRKKRKYVSNAQDEENDANSRKKRDPVGSSGEDGEGSSEKDLDVDVNVNINAPQQNRKADLDVNVNINADGDCGGTPSVTLSCSQGWILFEGSCYYFSTDKTSWTNSRQKCLDMGGDLVKITTDSEFYFLQKDLTDHTWIGLTDKDVEGVYRWVSDNSVHDVQAHRNWWHGPQPDDYGGREDYGHFLYRDGVYLLNDFLDYYWNSPYICEKMPTETNAEPSFMVLNKPEAPLIIGQVVEQEPELIQEVNRPGIENYQNIIQLMEELPVQMEQINEPIQVLPENIVN